MMISGGVATLRFAGDTVAAIGYVPAFAIALYLVFSNRLRDGAAVKALFVSSLAVYATVTLSAFFAYLSWPAMSDLTEDNLEVLFPLLVLGLVFAMYSAKRLEDVNSSQRALAQTHEFMMDMVDSAPAGIVFLDPDGRIIFANEAAKRVLELDEDETTGVFTGSGWNTGDPERPLQLPALVDTQPYESRSIAITWADGRRLELVANGSPRLDALGGLGGMAVTFERPCSPLNVPVR